ncbi:MAG: nucleotidyltransferase domain-containing protein [Planctomycetes bacterium]|nr:nucleotidyltransferase domain-containing protein [Planctomycetota bacterium]
MNATPEVRELIQNAARKIREGYGPAKIILFGSYAYGHPSVDSDVDFLVVKATSARPLDRWRQVRELVYEKGCGVSIQPIVMTPEEVSRRLEAGDPFVEEITHRGEVLYEQ